MKPRKNHSFRHGATLIEVVIVVAILLILLAIVGGGVGGRVFNRKAEAESQAREWAAFMYPSQDASPRVLCVERDTDGDGYISCTVSHTEKGASINVPIECAASILSWNSGCRTPKLGLRQ